MCANYVYVVGMTDTATKAIIGYILLLWKQPVY